MERDYQWFLDNYDDIYEKYGTSYVVIKDAKVLGSYASYGEAVRRTSETEPMGSFIVQFCNGDASGYTNYIASMNFCNA